MCTEFNVALTWIDTVDGSLDCVCVCVPRRRWSMSPRACASQPGIEKKIKIRREKERENAKWKEENKTQMIDLCCHRRIHRLMVAQVFMCTQIGTTYHSLLCWNDVACAHRWRWQQAMNKHLTSFHIASISHSTDQNDESKEAEKVNTWNHMDDGSNGKSSWKKFTE